MRPRTSSSPSKSPPWPAVHNTQRCGRTTTDDTATSQRRRCRARARARGRLRSPRSRPSCSLAARLPESSTRTAARPLRTGETRLVSMGLCPNPRARFAVALVLKTRRAGRTRRHGEARLHLAARTRASRDGVAPSVRKPRSSRTVPAAATLAGASCTRGSSSTATRASSAAGSAASPRARACSASTPASTAAALLQRRSSASSSVMQRR